MAETYAIEITPPDISSYRKSNTGIDYVTTFDSGKPGPHVYVNALTHGNEICGAIAVDRLFRLGVRPAQGKLSLGFANVAAFRTFDPRNPTASRFVDEDINRLWDAATLNGQRKSVELARARELRPFIETVDFLLDIHSMQHSTEALMLAGLTEKSLELAHRVGAPRLIVRDKGHSAGSRMRDYGALGDPASPKAALLIECGQHWEKAAADVAHDVTWRFLAVTGTLSPAESERQMTRPPADQRVITVTQAVTITSDRFEFLRDYRGLEVIPRQGTVIARDGGREVRTPYDNCVLIMPSRRLNRGQTAVRLGRYG
ncbi:MAG TPA: M14 family metallopeptidase [Stellaceae bacterium]|nr:M14 family metallopeptidase [Stellaceae bacterium]